MGGWVDEWVDRWVGKIDLKIQSWNLKNMMVK